MLNGTDNAALSDFALPNKIAVGTFFTPDKSSSEQAREQQLENSSMGRSVGACALTTRADHFPKLTRLDEKTIAPKFKSGLFHRTGVIWREY